MKSYAFIPALLLSLPAGAEPIDDPWSLVPPAPTACYDEQDNFLAKVGAALATLDEEISTQMAMNDDIKAGLGDTSTGEADPFAMAQRMQDYMMNNPEAATRMMQDLSATGQTFSEDLSQQIEREQELTGALDAQITGYRNAFAEMRAPIDATIKALPTEVVGEGFVVFTDEAIAQLPAINRQSSAAYEELCARWWKRGPLAAPLAEFRTFLIEEKVAGAEHQFDQTRQQLDIQGIDTSEYRSTAAMDAAADYLRQLQRIYVQRLEKPSDIHVNPEGTGG